MKIFNYYLLLFEYVFYLAYSKTNVKIYVKDMNKIYILILLVLAYIFIQEHWNNTE